MKKQKFGLRKTEDLVCECGKMASLPIKNRIEDHTYCSVSRMRLDGELAGLIGRREGSYSSVFFGNASELEEKAEDEIAKILSNEFFALCLGAVKGKKNFKSLVVGLGNGSVTHDSLGCAVCARLLPSENSAVYAVGVAAKSGIPTVAVTRALGAAANSDLVIAVDSLAARSVERVGRVVQLTDSGILQGSGVGAREEGLDAESVGVPVIAVGFPTAFIPEITEKSDGYLAVPCDLPLIVEGGARIISKALRMMLSQK